MCSISKFWFSAAILFSVCIVFLPIRKESRAFAGVPGFESPPVSLLQDNAPNTSSLESSLQTALAEGRNSDAQALFRSLLKQSQINPDLLLKAGVAFAQKGLYDDAALAFRRCVEEYPGIFEAHYNLALAEFARQRYRQALSALGAARAGGCEQRLALLYLRGKVENALGQSHEAQRDLTAAFSADPSEENYALDLGLFDLQHNAYPEAVKVFAKARQFYPHSVFTGLGLALAQYLSGRIPDCIETCQKLLSERPDFAPLRTLLAFGFYMQGNFREAEEAAGKGLNFPAPHPYLNYIDVATRLKLQAKDYDRMLSEISAAERQIPACGLCYFAQSKIDEARGARESAILDLEEAVRLDPMLSEGWYRLATLYGQTGQHAKASEARKRFTALQAAKSQEEKEMLRSAFLRALAKSEK